MSVPEHLWRFPTYEAIQSLARRFDLPYSDQMQDWEWQVADPNRLDEFLNAYESGDLTDDERFTLMETIFQSFEESKDLSISDAKWAKILKLVESNVDLHIYTVWYWSDLDNENEEDSWRITPSLREVLARHKGSFERKM